VPFVVSNCSSCSSDCMWSISHSHNSTLRRLRSRASLGWPPNLDGSIERLSNCLKIASSSASCGVRGRHQLQGAPTREPVHCSSRSCRKVDFTSSPATLYPRMTDAVFYADEDGCRYGAASTLTATAVADRDLGCPQVLLEQPKSCEGS
jgi:hypothetical protein